MVQGLKDGRDGHRGMA